MASTAGDTNCVENGCMRQRRRLAGAVLALLIGSSCEGRFKEQSREVRMWAAEYARSQREVWCREGRFRNVLRGVRGGGVAGEAVAPMAKYRTREDVLAQSWRVEMIATDTDVLFRKIVIGSDGRFSMATASKTFDFAGVLDGIMKQGCPE